MAIDAGLVFKGSEEEFMVLVRDYIYSEQPEYSSITLKYCDKWIWVNFEAEYEGSLYLAVSFSKDFRQNENEIERFIQEMLALGLINDEEIFDWDSYYASCQEK